MQDATLSSSKFAETAVAVPRPLYLQVREILATRIDQGYWLTGDTLPNELQLSTEFAVSVGTIRKAIDHLEDMGLVVRRQGRGTFVAGNRMKVIAERFNPLRLLSGEQPVLAYHLEGMVRRRPTRDEADRLNIETRHDIFVIDQTVISARQPIGREVSRVDARLIPQIDSALSSGRDLNQLFAEFGHVPAQADDIVHFSNSSPPDNTLPWVGEHGLLWRLTRVTRGSSSTPIELKSACYLADRVIYAGSQQCC